MIDLRHAENQIQCVSDFNSLIHAAFKGKINAFCWERQLEGDFAEIVNKVDFEENMIVLTPSDLLELKLSEQGQIARNTLLNDLKMLEEFGASPVLNIINYYDRDDAFPFFPTDVYSFHVDRSPVPTDTFLCTYHGAASDILPNSQGIQKILIPEIRTKLKELHDGSDDDFELFLREYFFDLHYQALPNAQPINTGIGHLWRIAIDHPSSEALPCLHRAPVENPGEKRLLLIC